MPSWYRLPVYRQFIFSHSIEHTTVGPVNILLHGNAAKTTKQYILPR